MRAWARLRPLKPESGELLHLDLLRFVASVGIVLTHSLEFYSPPAMRELSHARTGGLALFVDLFFIISGFVISYVYADRLGSAKRYGIFLQRRVGRLYPLHLATLAAATLVVVLLGRFGLHMQHQPALTPACLADGLLLLHAMVGCGGYVPNGVSWSISAEMAMYVLFPLFLLLGGRRPGRTLLLAAATLAVGVWVFGSVAGWADELSVARAFPAFILGVAYHHGRAAIARIPRPEIGLVAALALFVAGGFLLWPVWLLIALCYLVPVFAIAADGQGIAGAGVRRLAPLGQLTYSMYMLHGLVVMIVLNGLGDKLLHLSPLPMLALGLVTYAIIGTLSWMSLQLFETPARRWIDALPLFTARAGRPAGEAKADV